MVFDCVFFFFFEKLVSVCGGSELSISLQVLLALLKNPCNTALYNASSKKKLIIINKEIIKKTLKLKISIIL